MKGSIQRILAVTLNSFKEAVRNRAFIGMMIGALAMILASLLLSNLVVFDQQRQVVQDFGLFFISFGGVVIAIVIGTVLVFKDLERKTIYSVVSKPLNRFEFILGRYFGMLLILLVLVAILSISWFIVLHVKKVPFRQEYIQAVLLIYMELMIVGAAALLFSTFSTPILSGLYTFGLFAVGRVTYLIEEMLHARKGLFVSAPALKPLGKALVAVVPDLSLFDITREILLNHPVRWLYVANCFGYCIAYCVIFLLIAVAVFQRRDFV